MQEKAREKQQVAGTHINIADGSLKFGIQFITCAGRKKPKRITACPLEQGNEKKDSDACGSGEQDGHEMNTGKEKAAEEKEITKLGEQPFHPGVFSKQPD